MVLSQKSSSISESVTLKISAKSKIMTSEGINVINFSAGEPDFNTSEDIQNAAIDAIRKGYGKYTPVAGIPKLREAICHKLEKDNGVKYTPDQIVVSNGAKHSLYNSLAAICNPGDEVIISVPYWVSYPELIKLVDAVPVMVHTKEEDEFKYSIDELENAYSEKTKAIIINSPNNPTGSVYTEEELRQIGEFAVKHNIFIISDEIYEKIIYNDIKHVSISSLSPEIKEHTILVNGMSKAYAMTGWRIGYTACTQEIAKLMAGIQSHMTSNPNSIAQYASLEGLEGNQDMVKTMREEFEKRRDYIVEKINAMKIISCTKPHGAFYIMVNISKLKGKVIKGHYIGNSVALCEAMLDEARVAAVPGAGFGMDDFIRISYATSMENIIEGISRIQEFLS